jgi:hypothetical protein
MSDTPSSKSAKGASSSSTSAVSTKKQKKRDKEKSKSVQERSDSDLESTLDQIQEEGSILNDDQASEHSAGRLDVLESAVASMESQLTRITELLLNSKSQEIIPRNLDKNGYNNSTPKKHKDRSKKKTSIMHSVAQSSSKVDWRRLPISDDHGDSEDSDPSSSSSSNSEEDSDAGDDSSSNDGRLPNNNSDKSDGKGGSGDKGSKRGGKGDKTSKPTNRLYKSLLATEKNAAKTSVQVFKQEKECSVRIVDFKLSNLCRAMKAIIAFQEREGTTVKMTKVLDTRCKRHLLIRYNLTTDDLITMKLSTLFSIMARETKVHNTIHFYNEIKAALSHIKMMPYDAIGPDTHEAFYFQQLTLTEDFMMVLRIMLEENKQYCPKIENKEHGLIRLFSSFHPREYWVYIWTQMKQKYRTMLEFMDEYEELAMQHYELSVALKELPYKTSAAASKSADKETKYYDKKRDISKNLYRSSSSYPVKDKPKYNSFNNINHEDGFSSDDEEHNSCWVNAPPEQTDSQPTSQPSSQPRDEDSEDSLSQASNEEETDDDEAMLMESLMAFADHNVSKDKKDLACLRKIMSGKCEREDCPYGHKREVLMQGAATMTAKLKAFTDSQKGTATGNAGPPYKVLQKDKYGKH